MKWFDKKKFKYEIISEHKGEEAGIKSSTIKAEGAYLYGLMRAESGVHRLVRISPFDSGARRHTSFASVWIYPAIDDDINVNIEEKDLRIDTYRSSGAGGQHVNTTDSAVRITHLPTKIVVQCQNERSQHKNKETCFKMLKARLYEHEIQKKEEENQKELSSKTDIGWGHQIRSYVLQPYQLVKDLRSKLENTNPSSVLDGNIDQFIEEGLKTNDKKIIYNLFLFLLLSIILLTLILSTIGIETNKFNKIIVNKISKSKNIDLQLQAINFKLDVRQFSLFIETQNPKITYINQTIPVQNVKVYLDFLPLLKTDLKIKKIYVSLNELNYTQLNDLSKFIKPSNFKNFLNNKIKKVKFISEIEFF